MLYNTQKERIQGSADCVSCPYMDKKRGVCHEGIGRRCFEYDSITGICIDPVTKLPIKINNERSAKQ